MTAGDVEGTPWLLLLLRCCCCCGLLQRPTQKLNCVANEPPKPLPLSRKNGGRRWCKALLLYHRG